MLLVLVMEIAWSWYSTQGLKKDLQAYVDSGDWEQTYVREFYKSTKNFFMFNLILIFLSICIGMAAVGTENRHLILAFLFIFSMEWFFELIGVYNSREKNVVIYRMIPALLRPGLIVSTIIFYRTLSKLQSLLALEIEKEEANKPPSPPPAIRGIGRIPRSNLMPGVGANGKGGYTNPIMSKILDEDGKDKITTDEEEDTSRSTTGNNNDSPTATATTDDETHVLPPDNNNPADNNSGKSDTNVSRNQGTKNEQDHEKNSAADKGEQQEEHEDKNVIRISVE